MLLLSLLRGARRSVAPPDGTPGQPRRGPAHPEETLRFPLAFAGPTAILTGGFRPEKNTREFAPTDAAGLRAFAPQCLVAPLDNALELADQKLRGLLDLPSLEFAIVLTGVEDTPLADHHRDLLWRAFGIPVFEQLRNAQGRVIARECEVHAGLHLEPGVVLEEGFPFVLQHDHCECGAETTRLQPAPRKRAAAAA